MEHVLARGRRLRPTAGPDNLLQRRGRGEDHLQVRQGRLHYAHKRVVIHRDIKPSNIMLTNEKNVSIIDFASPFCATPISRRSRVIAGSPSYMSPEQVQGNDLTPRSDLYSLGAVM